MTTAEWWDANPEEHRQGGRSVGVLWVVLLTTLGVLVGMLVAVSWRA